MCVCVCVCVLEGEVLLARIKGKENAKHVQNRMVVMHWWSHDLSVMQSIFSTYVHNWIFYI